MLRTAAIVRAAIAAALCAACARTSMTSMPAPEVSGRSFGTILVIGSFADLGVRQQAETRFAAASRDGHTKFVASTSVLFPGRTYSQAEMASILHANSIDATLVVSPGQTGASSNYVPPTYTSNCTEWTSSGGCQQVTTTSRGGYNYAKPWAQFTAQLYDASTGQVVWYATATTGGNAYASATTLVHSMADKTLERLVSDRVVR
jgi:hypothetical protein